MIEYGAILRNTKKSFENGNQIIIHQGGTGSGKTYDIMMYILSQALKTKDNIFTVVSESIPHLDIGTIRIFKELINKNNLYQLVKFNESSRKAYFKTGSIIEFFSADRIDKALGARRYMLYCNEVNSLKYEVVDELARRSQFCIFDFNPTMEFWLEDKFIKYYDKIDIIKSNYKDNPFLPEHEKIRIEKRALMDNNFNRIHVLCEYGNADDLVFLPENIKLIDRFPVDVKYNYGLDFGFVAPTALIKVGVMNETIYVDEIIYKAGMNENDYQILLRDIDKRDEIIADSEDQRMISYLYNLKYNIKSAIKGAGSVELGISYMQGKTICITKNSTSTIKEIRNLMHAKNKEGKPTGKFDGDDHAIDAIRYALEKIFTSAKKGMGGITF